MSLLDAYVYEDSAFVAWCMVFYQTLNGKLRKNSIFLS